MANKFILQLHNSNCRAQFYANHISRIEDNYNSIHAFCCDAGLVLARLFPSKYFNYHLNNAWILHNLAILTHEPHH